MSIAFRIASTTIIAGLFVVAALVAVNYQVLSPGFYLIAVPLMGFLFFFSVAVGQHVARPMKKILDGAKPLEVGNGRSRMYLKTKDEIGELAKTFNKIAERFEEHKSKIETLDVNVKLRTKALEEIIAILEQKVKNRTAQWHQAVQELEQAHAIGEMKDREILDLHNQLAKTAKKVKPKKHARTS